MFIYLLILLIQQYENAFKIGCTENYSKRLPSYGGCLGPYEYEADIIEIIEVPTRIKLKFKHKVNDHRLCNYAEAYLHSIYKNSRVNNPTSRYLTEYFNPPEKRPDITDIIKKLEEVGIKIRKVGKYDKYNHLESTTKINKKEKSTQINKITPYKITEAEENDIIEKYSNNPLLFINEMILNQGSKLRLIQSELWEKLNENSNEINGIIKWPTGTGKRIAIIMIVIVLYLYYKNKGKIFRCVIAANRNDIFQGDAWDEYRLIKNIGLTVMKGSEGELSKLEIKNNESFLLVTTHQSLVTKNKENDEIDELTSKFNENLSKLKIDCMIYDETQNITSSKMYDHLINNRPDHLIGISATPYTDDEVQNRKINNLFKKKYISECSYERAIKEKWINDCKYYIYGYDKDVQSEDKIIEIIERQIRIRNDLRIWESKKFIIWIPENNEKKNRYIKYFKKKNKWKVFTDINDKEFKQCNTTDIPWCLVLCQRGREGYDRKDIEFGVSIGNSANHLYIQEQGRSQRIDYDGKSSELLIFTDKDKIDDIYHGISKYMSGKYGEYIEEIGNIEDIDIEEEFDSEAITKFQLEVHEKREALKKALEKQKQKEEEELQNRLKIRHEGKKTQRESFKKKKLNSLREEAGVSMERLKKIIEDEKIKSPTELIERREELMITYRINIQYHDIDIDWSRYNDKYYQDANVCIKSIEEIYRMKRAEIRKFNKRQKHELYTSEDNMIPPYNETETLWTYWGKKDKSGNKYTGNQFKLSD